MSDVLDAIRHACAQVARRARHVAIDADRLSDLARGLEVAERPPSHLDPARRRLGDAGTLAYVVTLDAINFGSGYFPFLTKRPGRSGYFTVACALEDRFQSRGPWSPADLLATTPGECAAVFGQDLHVAPVAELMDLFAKALNELGRFLVERHAGRFEGPLEEAGGSAARLVELLAEMSAYRDVARYEELSVPFYKRAQLTCADLAVAFGGRGWGRFRDLARLTLFADNLVPHVLRCEGVLRYEADLARRIDAGEPIAAGSREEVEIRAGAVHAVELCVGELRARGADVTAQELDYLLWTRGQRPEMKARPRHRTRTTFY